MAIDRNLLKGLCFLSKCGSDVPHARIPNELIQELCDLDALAVYCVLRSKPPVHRWKIDTVKHMVKEVGLQIGKNRVEEAMSYLRKSGWITYVIIKGHTGQRRGSIVQVHTAQLPKELRSKSRLIQFDEDGSFKIFDFDGITELSKKDFNAGWNGNAEPASMAKGAMDIPVPRDPGDWFSGEQYKGDPIGEPSIPSGEGKRAVPLEEEPVAGPIGPATSVEPLGESTFPEEADEETVSEEPVPCDPDIPAVDWGRVHEMARAAREGEEHRAAYHKLLVAEVFPALKDAPLRSKHWKAVENVEWCRASAKGQFLLSCAVENDWSADLARRLRRSTSVCSLADCRMILRTGVFAESASVDLRALIPGDKKSGCGAAWRKMVEAAKKRDESLRKNVERRIRNFPSSGKIDGWLKAEAMKRFTLALEDDYLNPDETQDDANLFFALLSVHFRWCTGSVFQSVDQWIRESRDKLVPRMARFIASDKLGAAIALRSDVPEKEVWGTEWDMVREQHILAAEDLKLSAALYGIEDSIVPDPTLFEREPDLDSATREGLNEIARERRARAAAMENRLS